MRGGGWEEKDIKDDGMGDRRRGGVGNWTAGKMGEKGCRERKPQMRWHGDEIAWERDGIGSIARLGRRARLKIN